VISKIPQKTSHDLKSNIRYARAAEDHGFEYALTQIRFTASYGAWEQHESVTFSQALLHHTKKLKVIAALLPGPWNPTLAAKQIASIDNYTDGRIAVNIVSGWFKGEFTAIGQWWLEHAERYRRSKEFITALKGIWTAGDEGFTFGGDFYQFVCSYLASARTLMSIGSVTTVFPRSQFRNLIQRSFREEIVMMLATMPQKYRIGIS
jgi:alkanesulfonate monooxygenase